MPKIRLGILSLAFFAATHLCVNAQADANSRSGLSAVALAELPSFGQLAELTSSIGSPIEFFGSSIAVSGSTVVVGAELDTVNGVSRVGAAYVFTTSSGWGNLTQVARLTASDGVSDTRMGNSIAISGDTIVVGATGVLNSGPAYVFVKPSGGWADMTQTAELSHTDGYSYDGYANSVGISGDTIVVGSNIGAYVYVLPAGGWVNATQTAKLTNAADVIGLFVAMQGNTVVATDYTRDSVGVFTRPTGGWANASFFNAELTASDANSLAAFGNALAISARTIVVGSPHAHGTGQSPPGAVYVYEEPANGWVSATETAQLTVLGQPTEELGYSVTVSGKFIAAGAIGARGLQGAAYLYSAPSGGWVTTSSYVKRMAAGSGTDEDFGSSVAGSGSTVFVGAPLLTIGSNIYEGASFVFGQ